MKTVEDIMKGVEFIGIYKEGGRDAVRGVILDPGLFNESLMVFYLGVQYGNGLEEVES